MKKILLSLVICFLITTIGQAQTKNWTLKECVTYASAHNISIQQADLDNQSASIDKNSAIDNFLPTVSANASHSWNIGLSFSPITNQAITQTTQNTSAGINSNLLLYNGLQNQNKLRRANLSIIANQYQLSKMKDDVSLNIANAFLQILYNKENLKVRIEQQSISEKQVLRTTELVNAGSIPKGDLFDMKATLASNKQAVVVAENALLISKLSLAQLLQLDDFQNFDIAEDTIGVQTSQTMLQTPASIFEKAKQSRVELKIAKTNLEISEKNIQIAKGAYQPSLNAFYSFSTRASNADRLGSDSNGNPIVIGPLPLFNQFSDNKGHSFGFQLNIPILNGFAVRNNVAKSKIALERSKIAYRQQELDLERNVYTAFNDAKGAMNTYESAIATLEARTEAYNYAKEKFAVGMMNAFDLNQSQTLFINAQSDVIRTKYDYMFKTKVIEFYFGIPIIQE